MLNQGNKGALKDIGHGLVAEAGTSGDGIDKPLVALNKQLPSGFIAPPAR
ncbi:MAG: hypothetical protein OHK0015_10430 [Chloroflexi bacterium OHK40]